MRLCPGAVAAGVCGLVLFGGALISSARSVSLQNITGGEKCVMKVGALCATVV